MTEKVYIVVGQTGEHSWYADWNVAAYRERDVADLHARHANEWLVKHRLDQESAVSPFFRSNDYPAQTGVNPYDPGMEITDNGTRYWVVEVPLFLHPDEFVEAEEVKKIEAKPWFST